MLTENRVTELLVIYLGNNNYSEIKALTSTQKGVDIIAISPKKKKILIEVKGDTSANENSKRFGKLFTKNQIWNHVGVAILKTMLDMGKPVNSEFEFALALPFSHKDLILKLESSIKKLGIKVFFVSEDTIEVFI